MLSGPKTYQRRYTLRIPRTFLRKHHLCAYAWTSKNTSATYTLTVDDEILRHLERSERAWLDKQFITWMHRSANASTRDNQGFNLTTTHSWALQWGCRLASRLAGCKPSSCYVVVRFWTLCGYQPVSVRHSKNAFHWNGANYKRVHTDQKI